MIVLDTSVVIDLLLDSPPYAEVIARRVAAEAPELYAPHLLDVEVAQVLRRFVLSGAVPIDRAWEALDDLLELPIHRYPHAPLLKRAFELRNNVTMYDALYLVLAEGLGAVLLTRDSGLAGIAGIAAEVEIVTAGS